MSQLKEEIAQKKKKKIQEEKNYYNGKEEGVQRIWDSIGNLISNYTVKNNKIYGALSAKDCMPVTR